MRRGSLVLLLLLATAAGSSSARSDPTPDKARILLLHHSTGQCIWDAGLEGWLGAYGAKHGKAYTIREQAFPKDEPYGWENYPYDYYNIWVKHAGKRPYRGEPTLEMLAPKHDLIVFKHCFPVSNIEADTGHPDIDSPDKRIENYRLQYTALRTKLRAFPDTRFLVWTGAALLARETTPAAARRAGEFFAWVKGTWDRPGDNIFVWDFYALETDGGIYLKDAYADGDSHPNEAFSKRVAPFLGQRIVDVIEGRGDGADIKGEHAESIPSPAEPTEPTEPAEPTADEDDAPAHEPDDEPGPERARPSETASRIFEDAEAAAAVASRWGDQARRVAEGEGHALQIDFTKGRIEDWGEYGPHRVVETQRGPAAHDVSGHRYLALRVRTDREVVIPLALVTRDRPRAEGDPRHYAFTAYLRLESGPWRQVVFDLAALELEVEGAAFYESQGSPSRPGTFTSVRLSIHERNAKADVRLDDVTFLGSLPEDLEPFLQSN